MTVELNDPQLRSQAIARRFELDEQIAILQGRHKAELAPLQEELGLCERFVAQSMIQANEQSVKVDGVGMTYFTTQDSVKVGNWDEVLAYIKENSAFELLNQAVNKSACKEFAETNKQFPPGVSYEARKVLAWRRGKA